MASRFALTMTMTFFLRYVSGVTLLEKSLKSDKPGYANYVRSTIAFIPWFRQK